MKIFIISLILIAIAFAGIAIKILIKKNGEFSGTCASQNPLINKEGEACGLCGAMPDEQCKNLDSLDSESDEGVAEALTLGGKNPN